MTYTNEECVTKLLSRKEIIKGKHVEIFKPNPDYNLGDFLMREKHSTSKWGSKYLFVK